VTDDQKRDSDERFLLDSIGEEKSDLYASKYIVTLTKCSRGYVWKTTVKCSYIYLSCEYEIV
jgi:hypothetical protein